MPTLDTQKITFRLMSENDLPAILAVQAQAYAPAFQESQEVFLHKLQLAPDFCWLAELENQIVGYLFSHPWQGDLPPALHTNLESLPGFSSCWFVHDMAFLPQARGLGLAKRLYEVVLLRVRQLNFSQSLLVSMPGVGDFWRRCGYQIIESLNKQQQEKMAQYGAGACLMRSESLK